MTLYSFDTSVLIESWNRRLPPATFVSFWERLDEVINAGTIRAVDEVRNELTRDDNLSARSLGPTPGREKLAFRQLLSIAAGRRWR